MELKKLSDNFIEKLLDDNKKRGGFELDEKILRVFEIFKDQENVEEVYLKATIVNTARSTAIRNLIPVAENIVKNHPKNIASLREQDYVNLVDKFSLVTWTNKEGKNFTRNNLSFASKYTHFLSDYQVPVFDEYVWIMIRGYTGQHGGKFSFTKPSRYQIFYEVFKEFTNRFGIERSYYEVDKFLWEYCKQLLENIKENEQVDLNKAKTILKRKIKNNIQK